MGCSSSALNKAGDGSRLRSEESESCLAQPKPRTLGKESSALHGKVQKESPPPVEKLKISAVSRANGVKSLWEQPLANDAADPPGPTADTQPLEGPEESGPLQPGGKDDTPGAEEKNDIEAMTEAQSLKGNAETESLGRDTKYEPLQITGERDSPGAVDATETPQTAREMSPIRTAEKVPPQEAVGEPQPQEAMGKAEQTQLPETAPKEIERPETLEGGHVVEMAEERQLQETLGKDEHSQLLETVPRENETPEVLEESQFAETAGNNDLLHKAPEGLGNMEQIQPEGIVGSVEHPAGILETGANMEMVIHTNEEDQHIEGETGEKVETEMENENVSDGAGTKEEETGEAVDLSAAL